MYVWNNNQPDRQERALWNTLQLLCSFINTTAGIWHHVIYQTDEQRKNKSWACVVGAGGFKFWWGTKRGAIVFTEPQRGSCLLPYSRLDARNTGLTFYLLIRFEQHFCYHYAWYWCYFVRKFVFCFSWHLPSIALVAPSRIELLLH